jgi:hypothetical protein
MCGAKLYARLQAECSFTLIYTESFIAPAQHFSTAKRSTILAFFTSVRLNHLNLTTGVNATMARVRRTADHSLWFNPDNFDEGAGEGILASLIGLTDGQQVCERCICGVGRLRRNSGVG